MNKERRRFIGACAAALVFLTAPLAAANTFFRKKARPYNVKFHESIDATVWAEAFVAHVEKDPAIATDEGTMIAWFATAIMRGWDEGRKRYGPELLEQLADWNDREATMAEAMDYIEFHDCFEYHERVAQTLRHQAQLLREGKII